MFPLHSSLFDVKNRVNFIKAGTAPIFGADMSVLVWVSLPKLRLTQLIEKMTNSLAYGRGKLAGRGFSGRMLSDGGHAGTGGHRLRETRLRLAPALAGGSTAFSHRPSMHDGKIFQ